jgi:uncharacterized protein (TIGR00730 family)
VRIAVFTGSHDGPPSHRAAAAAFATDLAKAGTGIVYGGGHVGLMGVVADAALEVGGEVVGVIPQHLVDDELAHPGLPRLDVVDSMHERKARMAELADAFIALPGGIGTLEELIEVYTWSQLGLHRKPLGVLNVNGYYDALGAFLDQAVRSRFLHADQRAVLRMESDPRALVDSLAHPVPPPPTKWVDR